MFDPSKPRPKTSMPMFRIIQLVMNGLRPAFTREIPYYWFGTGLYSLLFGNQINGVQSMINALDLSDNSYYGLDRMYRSSAINLPLLRKLWLQTIVTMSSPLMYSNMRILIGDGSKSSKEARKMPGVCRLHNNSDTQSKPSSYHGIQGGGISILVKGGPNSCNPNEVYCIPISMELNYGLDPISDWANTPHPDAAESLETQMLNRQKEYMALLGPTLTIQDRASMAQNLFAETEQMRKDNIETYLLTNARIDCKAYEEPVRKPGAGRPPKRGKGVKVATLFETRKDDFKTGKRFFYGKEQTFQYLAVQLRWGDKWNGKLLFVLAVLEDGRRIILATDKLDMDPCDAVELYAYRFLIEEGFRQYKQEFAGMNYHFWTKAMEHLSHFRKKEEGHILDEATTEEQREKILAAIKAAEVYMEISCIAQGITQLISMDQPIDGTVQQFTRKRTNTHRKVSERDIRNFLHEKRELFWTKYKDDPIVKFIRDRQVFQAQAEWAAL